MSETPVTELDVINSLKRNLGHDFWGSELRPHAYGRKRVFVTVDARANRDAVRFMLNGFNARLSTISGVDSGDTLGVVYHLPLDTSGMVVSLKVTDLPRDHPKIESVSDIIPAAAYMEMEVHDLFGVEFAGNPFKRKWIVADDWPEGKYPLRKDFVPEE